MMPKSGQVPTTTTAPLARSRLTASPSRRADCGDAVEHGDVVGADHDDRGVGGWPGDEHRVDLTGQPLRGGAHNCLGAQPDSLTGQLGQAAAQQHAGHLVGVFAAVPGGGRVAEHHQVQIERDVALPALHRPAAAGVHAVGARRDVPGFRDDLAGLARLARSAGCGCPRRRTRECLRLTPRRPIDSVRVCPRRQFRRPTARSRAGADAITVGSHQIQLPNMNRILMKL